MFMSLHDALDENDLTELQLYQYTSAVVSFVWLNHLRGQGLPSGIHLISPSHPSEKQIADFKRHLDQTLRAGMSPETDPSQPFIRFSKNDQNISPVLRDAVEAAGLPATALDITPGKELVTELSPEVGLILPTVNLTPEKLVQRVVAERGVGRRLIEKRSNSL